MVEYGYYFSTGYTTLGVYFGLEIPLLAAGLTELWLSFVFNTSDRTLRKSLLQSHSCSRAMVASIGVQIVLHQASIRDPDITLSVLWIRNNHRAVTCNRPGFFYRCAIVLFVIGIIPLRELTLGGAGDGAVHQAHVDAAVQGNLSPARGLAYWFGFCAVFFGIAGLKEKRLRIQILYWVAAVGCLLVVALTVERGALLAAAIALTIAFRRILKHGFLPILLLLVLTGIVLESGLFADSVAQYQTRGLEETGRLIIWPIIIERTVIFSMGGCRGYPMSARKFTGMAEQ